jgi:cytoskeleton protein RodZ
MNHRNSEPHTPRPPAREKWQTVENPSLNRQAASSFAARPCAKQNPAAPGQARDQLPVDAGRRISRFQIFPIPRNSRDIMMKTERTSLVRARGERRLASFGARLKQEREKRNKSLEDVSRSTKISLRMLQALEEEHFDRLPGGVFNKGFVRAYARCLELNEQQAVDDYLAATGPSQKVEEPQVVLAAIASQKIRTTKPRRSGAESFPWELFALALLVVAFGFAVWGSYQHAGPAAHSLAAASQSPEAAEATSSARPERQTLSASVEDLGSNGALSPLSPAGGTFVVLVKANADCWLDVTADGRDFMHDTLEAGQEKSIPAHSQVVIKAGNTGGINLWFNGRQLTVPGRPDQVRTLVFTAKGLQPSSPKLQPAAQSEPGR